MTKAQQLLMDGVAAFKAKAYDRAEGLLLSAMKGYPPADSGRRTACIHLGMIYRKQDRHDEAIAMLEAGLPYPAAFKELVVMYRGFAKEMAKRGDAKSAGEWYRRMYCLAKIQEGVRKVRDLDRAAPWLDQIRAQCGTLYAHEFDGREIAGDDLLSQADYKALCGR